MKQNLTQIRGGIAREAAFDFDRQYFMFWALACAALALALAYVWFINVSVHNVVERKQLGDTVRAMSLELAPLEAEYISLAQEVTLSRAHELGFVDAASVTFASAGEHKNIVTVR